MTNVMIFTRRNTTQRWRYISDHLNFAKKTTFVGLSDDQSDVNVMTSFYRHCKIQDTAKFALSEIGADACDEIIRRCRLLRNLDSNLALKMIGAMWKALDETISHVNPDIVLSFIVDFYPVDILKRLLGKRKIYFFGLGGGILKDHMIVTTEGEYNFVHEPSENEVKLALEEIMMPNFAPSVVAKKKYNFPRFAKTKMFWQAREIGFGILKRLKSDPLNPEFLVTPKRGDDYHVRWRDWNVTKYMDANWEEKIHAVTFEKRVFVGLQYYPEATTDYWVKDLRLANCIASLAEISRVLTANGFTVFIKDHPVMFGLRRIDIYECLSQIENVVFVPYPVKSQEIITLCKTIFTWTGTIGIQAALAGRCSVVSTTYYRTKEDFVHLDTWDDIASLPERIDAFQIPRDLELVRLRVAHKVCSSHIPGSLDWVNFDPEKSNLTGTHALIDSLNRYVPQFLEYYREEELSSMASVN